MKITEVVNALKTILEQARASEHHYRMALSCMQQGSETISFIYFWQEHARMMAELEDKIRWLGGSVPDEPNSAWQRFVFKTETAPAEVTQALLTCKHSDEELLRHYQNALKGPLPVDVRTLLKMHLMKLGPIQAKLLKLESVHRAGRVRVDFHAGNAQDGVLGEVVLQA
jgi:hypothetical protein